MGTWGAGGFENDDAGDWVWELAEAEDTSILEEAFSRVLEAEDVEASDCMIAIAAAEVVAALRKRPSVKPPDEVVEYVTRIGAAPSPDLVQTALEATKRIQKKSELQELWDESEGRAEWDKSIEELEGRLR